jgi:hypothetical protein
MTIEDSTPEDELGEEELDNVSGAGSWTWNQDGYDGRCVT